MSLTDRIEIFVLVFLVTIICILIFNIVVIKSISKKMDESYIEGYNRAVDDITRNGYYVDKDGEVRYVITTEYNYMELKLEEMKEE